MPVIKQIRLFWENRPRTPAKKIFDRAGEFFLNFGDSAQSFAGRLLCRFLLYVVAEGPQGPCKIGYGNAPGKRLKNLQIGNSRLLTLHSTWVCQERSVPDCESLLHHMFGRRYLRGEWFDISVSDAEAACTEIGMARADSTYDFTRGPKLGDTRLSWLI